MRGRIARADGRPRPAGARAGRAVSASARRAASVFLRHADDDVRSGLKRRWTGFARAGMSVREIEIPHTDTIATVYLRIALREAAVYHAPMLDVGARALHPARSPATRDGTGAFRWRTTCARSPGATSCAATSSRNCRCGALVLPTLPIPAPAVGAEFVQVGRDERTAAQHDAPADAALQHHRTPRDFDPVRSDARRDALRPATGRRT